MATIDKHGAVHAGDGKYANKPQDAAGFDLATGEAKATPTTGERMRANYAARGFVEYERRADQIQPGQVVMTDEGPRLAGTVVVGSPTVAVFWDRHDGGGQSRFRRNRSLVVVADEEWNGDEEY